MAVREVMRRGKRVWFIDIRYRKQDGTLERFRRDTKAATKSAAKEEEKRIRDRIARTGSPYEGADDADTGSVPTFADVVERYRATYMVTDLKVTTRRGYESILNGILIQRLGSLPITSVDGEAAAQLDVELVEKGGERKGKLTRKTRNNVQIVLRSVLRWAAETGQVGAMPSGLPRLKRIDRTILEIPSDEEVQIILGAASELHRRSFALMAYAGLRPNEVRALRRRDVQLRWEGGEPVGGFLSIREGRSFGHVDTPKTGPREIPIAPQLARLLAPGADGPRDGHVALSERGAPWGQFGLDQAFERVRDRTGLAGWSIYALRHYAITSWLRAGVQVHVVQRMAGHKHLSTTQRYVHFLKSDLEDAARRLAAVGNMWATPSSDLARSTVGSV